MASPTAPASSPSLTLRRAAERGASAGPGIEGRHCFSYGPYYDPANVSFGPLAACNDFVLAPGAGFEPHSHAGLEILSWIAAGELVHTDATGTAARLRPGHAQRLSAGTGIEHGERNGGTDPLRLIQLWIVPDRAGPPEHAVADVGAAIAAGRPVPIAAGRPDRRAFLTLRQASTAVYAARLAAGASAAIPAAQRCWLYVVRGTGVLTAAGAPRQEIGEGDEARGYGASAVTVLAGAGGVEVLFASFDAPAKS